MAAVGRFPLFAAMRNVFIRQPLCDTKPTFIWRKFP